MTTLGKRIEKTMQERNISRKDLAQTLEISTMAVGNLINDEVKKPRNLVEIANVLGVDAIWLLTGKGKAPTGTTVIATTEQDDIILEVLDQHASAGDGVSGSDTVEIIRQLRYAPTQFHSLFPGVNPKNIRVISAKGDSMYPTIDHGALMFVDISVNYFDGDGVYIFNYDQYNYVKRLQKAGKVLRVISDNKSLYPKDWEVSGEEIAQVYILGKVKAVQNQKLEFIG